MSVPPIDPSRFLRARWVILALLALVLVPLLRGVPSLVTDYLWFGEVGYRQVFVATLGTQVVLQFAFGGAFLLVLLGNLLIALRRSRPNFPVLHELRAALPAIELLHPRLRLIAVAVSLFLTLHRLVEHDARRFGLGRGS